MKIVLSETSEQLGEKAAALAAGILNEAISARGVARMVMSTGASQFTTIAALLNQPVDWTLVEMFHLDEYIGLDQTHPASFVKYLKERFTSKVSLKEVNFVDPSPGVDEGISALTERINKAPIDLAFIGIGENAHIAFNDPPADFNTQAAYAVVNMDAACRNQQLGEGWFATLNDVPRQAISMTSPQIMKARHIISSVPYAVKAKAMRDTLSSDVTNMIPATILKTHPSFTLFLDKDSASLADAALLAKFDVSEG